MKKNVLYHHVKERLKSIEKNLCAYSKRAKPRHLHLLRLDIKITKALFSFAEDLTKEFCNAIVLKAIFQKAGEIREIQIMIKLLNSSQDLPEKLMDQLEKKEKYLKKQFLKNISKHIKSVKHFRKGVSFPPIPLDEETIKAYFETELEKANQKFQDNNREGLHQFRKSIKKLMFVYEVLPKKIRKEVDLNKRDIDKLQEKVGNWHDTYLAIDFLSNSNFPEMPVEFLSKLREKEIRQLEALFTDSSPFN